MKSPFPVLLIASASLATAQNSATASTSTSTGTGTSAASSSTATVNCDLPHLIVARGSSEQPGLGRIGVVAGNVTEKIKGATVEALDYPANFTGYFTSEPKGVSAMDTAVKSYLEKCEDGKIVLMGYSQGAHVVADLVCGTSEKNFNKTADMTPDYQDNIVAVVLFGDPSHIGNATFNVGTSTRDGIFPRTDIDACEPYIPKMRSWCDTGDIYCDSGSVAAVHGSYFGNYTDDASDWVVEMWENFQADEDGDSTATSTTTGTGGATETSSAAGTASPSTAGSGAGNIKPVAGMAALAGLVALMW